MMTTKFPVCLFVLFTATFAATAQRHMHVLTTEENGFAQTPSTNEPVTTMDILPVEDSGFALDKSPDREMVRILEEYLPIHLDRQESALFNTESSEVGHGRLTRVGVRVNRGATATLRFNVTVRAVEAEVLDQNDSEFVKTLTSRERVRYDELKKAYNKGLNIPVFSWLGANFDKDVTLEELDREASTQTNYAAKARAASKILNQARNTRIRIDGTLKATGVSFIPTRALAFIKLARVEFKDGTSQLVVSSNSNDVIAAESNGDELPSSDSDVDIACVSGFYC